MPALKVAALAELCQGAAKGDLERTISGANSLKAAGPSDLSFVVSSKANTAAADSKAGCLVVLPSFDVIGDWSIIRVSEPRAAFAKCLAHLYQRPRRLGFTHPSAIIAANTRIASDCYIGAYTIIEAAVHIGSGCCIGDQVHIGEGVRIGEHTTIHPHVTLYHDVQIGSNVILHSGSVIGADGFGFALTDDHYEKFPQVGTVHIQDYVEIGANSCIDRAALGVTLIGTGTKLDNLVHIAHNCSIGKHVVIAAQTGFAGGVVVDDYAVIGGQVGAGEKATIASKAVVASKAGILSYQRVPAKEPVWGIPARPVRQHLKGLANVSKIPELREQLRQLKNRIDALETSKRGES